MTCPEPARLMQALVSGTKREFRGEINPKNDPGPASTPLDRTRTATAGDPQPDPLAGNVRCAALPIGHKGQRWVVAVPTLTVSPALINTKLYRLLSGLWDGIEQKAQMI